MMNAPPDVRLAAPVSLALAGPFPATPSPVDRTGEPWDEYQRAWILDLRARGHDTATVAAAVGRTVATVYAQFQLLGSRTFERRTWSDADATRAIERAKASVAGQAGETMRDIAASYGRSVDQMRAMFSSRGYRPKLRNDWTPAQVDALRAFLAEADPEGGARAAYARFGETVGRSAFAVRDRAKAMGIALAGRKKPRVERPPVPRGRPRRVWNDEVTTRVRDLLVARGGERGAVAAIAAETGVSVRTVKEMGFASGALARIRARKGMTEANAAAARELAPSLPATTVARRIGCGARVLKAWAKAEGVAFATRAPAGPRPAFARPQARKAMPRVEAANFPLSPGPRAVARGMSKVAARHVEAGGAVFRVPVEPRRPERTTKESAVASKATAPRVILVQPTHGPSPGAAWKAAKGREPKEEAPRPDADDRRSDETRDAARMPAAMVTFVAPLPPPEEALRKRAFRRPTSPRAKPADGKAVLRDAGDAIAAFLATRGVTRTKADPRTEIETAVRRRGYALVGEGGGYRIDGRHVLADEAALRTFAEARGIVVA